MLRVFGCLCFPNLRPYNWHKMHFRFTPWTFLGCNNRYKSYKCLNEDEKIYVACNVIFYENIFPYITLFLKIPIQESWWVILYLSYKLQNGYYVEPQIMNIIWTSMLLRFLRVHVPLKHYMLHMKLLPPRHLIWTRHFNSHHPT